jgi:hypothetical protein
MDVAFLVVNTGDFDVLKELAKTPGIYYLENFHRQKNF